MQRLVQGWRLAYPKHVAQATSPAARRHASRLAAQANEDRAAQQAGKRQACGRRIGGLALTPRKPV